MLGLGLIWKWVSEQYNSVLLTKQYLGSGQKKFYSQSAHMKEMHDMFKQAKSEFFGFIRDHGTYNNSYIKGEVNEFYVDTPCILMVSELSGGHHNLKLCLNRVRVA